MTGFSMSLSKDAKSIIFGFPTTPPKHFKLGLSGVLGTVKAIGELRAKMTPEVSRAPPSGQVQVLPDPQWYCSVEAMSGDTLLSIRDPRYGWLTYSIPKVGATKLASLIMKQVEMPDRPAGKVN